MKPAVNAVLQNSSESWFAGILRCYALYVVKSKIGIPFHFRKIYDRAMKLLVVALSIVPCRSLRGNVSDSMQEFLHTFTDIDTFLRSYTASSRYYSS